MALVDEFSNKHKIGRPSAVDLGRHLPTGCIALGRRIGGTFGVLLLLLLLLMMLLLMLHLLLRLLLRLLLLLLLLLHLSEVFFGAFDLDYIKRAYKAQASDSGAS